MKGCRVVCGGGARRQVGAARAGPFRSAGRPGPSASWWKSSTTATSSASSTGAALPACTDRWAASPLPAESACAFYSQPSASIHPQPLSPRHWPRLATRCAAVRQEGGAAAQGHQARELLADIPGRSSGAAHGGLRPVLLLQAHRGLRQHRGQRLLRGARGAPPGTLPPLHVHSHACASPRIQAWRGTSACPAPGPLFRLDRQERWPSLIPAGAHHLPKRVRVAGALG